MSKDSFIFYSDWANYILALSDHDALELSRAILARGVGKDYEIGNPAVKAYFDAVIVPDMDENERAKEEYRERQAAKGRKSAKVKADKKANQSQPNSTTVNQTQPRLTAVNRTQPSQPKYGYGYGYGISANADINARASEQPADLSEILPERAAAEMQKWLNVRQSIGPFPYTAITEALSQTKAAIDKYGEDACIEAIKTATAGAHKAIYYDRLIRPPREQKKKGWNIESHEYDWSVLDG